MVPVLAALYGMFWYFSPKIMMAQLMEHLPLVMHPLRMYGMVETIRGYLKQGDSLRDPSKYDSTISYGEYFQLSVLSRYFTRQRWRPFLPLKFGTRISLRQLLEVLFPAQFLTALQELVDWHLAHEETLTSEQLIEMRELFGPKVQPLLTLEAIEELYWEDSN
ncbi:hypothetical protein BO82DRAFT_402595 [Aspergillus uvarum CBS 121591]|uniref:Uncharacterized protein n=1 Tax=Aspergillus uvarum CBS 121591 TaxID=1448315 RepID=A0A319CRG8_9EURO|nr:hypothetical protein BO82DRAFT_402595 [Aspergillus uvarum CBS 121591]PYH81333.1 hypothetical protein BO82DRAFT_402595 [Aspergillus uvarum CBS 121591]